MAYPTGATHAVSISGFVVVAEPAGIRVQTTTVPASAGIRVGSPPTYYGLGHVAFGDGTGWSEPHAIRHLVQDWYPIPPGITRVGVTLQLGVALTLTELGAVPIANALKQPWDRNPWPVVLGGPNVFNGGYPATTTWSYTVPTGRKLYVAHASVLLRRWSLATTNSYAQGYITLYGAHIVNAVMTSNVMGAAIEDRLSSAPLILEAGATLAANMMNYDTGGAVHGLLVASGFIFDE